ncbi:2-aminoadipate transaminase [Clostridium homopropionicum DSM 5847]|uniref:2-aminoadipate transaminase n=1 Tax=Clostridium homopropionicum DSM 5847 TaxID=1121318 RepID=A0A0L6ZDN9_9CLOT|nr:PLP-dependent aminotransferase family protein [Clostridium homopropionicum]KOA21096.1 2-aminoadipate transaminase [Clostridium homopropionicum DSM 5847]SFF97411.1 transcriptional regulator, GntR family [Clostridium homopropionicum]
MDKYIIEFNEEEPKYIQIVRHIKKLIKAKELKNGEKLPSIRELSKLLKVNSVTIVNAYKKLETEGQAIQKMGSGTYVKVKEENRNFLKEYSKIYKKISGGYYKDFIDFTGETTCSDFFPVDTFKRALNEVLDRDGADAFSNEDALGFLGLRDNINKYFWKGKLNNENIIIVSGAQQGIDIAAKAIINIDDNIIVEKPTYSGALNVFRSRRAKVFEVEINKDGIDINSLRSIVKKHKIKCFYLMSYFQNPTGSSYSLNKKKEILNLAEEYDFYIIEDDYLSELIYDANIKYESFKSLDRNDRVVYIRSFSKIFLPGIRMGYLITPDEFNDAIQNSKINTDRTTSSLMQRTLDLYMNSGYWKAHIKKLNASYKSRYIFMEKCIKEILGKKVEYNSPGGGLSFYLKISDNIDVNCIELFNSCLKHKVVFTPGVLFYKDNNEGYKYFKLSFSQTNNNQIREGINIINSILK